MSDAIVVTQDDADGVGEREADQPGRWCGATPLWWTVDGWDIHAAVSAAFS